MCKWKNFDEDFGEWYDTECGGSFSFIEGDREDNGYVYCPKCGEKIE